MQVLVRCLAASYRRKLNILSTHKSMLSEGAAMPDESVDFCLQRRIANENYLQQVRICNVDQKLPV